MRCLTLLSDFGIKDATVAIAKGILVQHVPAMPIFDICHEVRPYHTGQAAYLLAAAYNNFPPGSVHLVLFDVFSDAPPRLVLCAQNGHYFLSPDNGVIPLALGGNPMQSWLCLELAPSGTFNDWLHEAGRITALLQDNAPIPFPAYSLKPAPGNYLPTVTANIVKCEAIHIDQYENVVVNITRTQFAALTMGRPFSLQYMQMEEITTISANYTDVREGYKLCRFNSSGYLEICINRGKAASLFGLRLGSKNNNIKLYFE